MSTTHTRPPEPDPDTKLYVMNVLRLKAQLEKGWNPAA